MDAGEILRQIYSFKCEVDKVIFIDADFGIMDYFKTAILTIFFPIAMCAFPI